MTVSGERVFAGSAYIDEEKVGLRVVTALSAKTGEKIWEVATAHNPWGPPSIAGDLVISGCSSIRFDPQKVGEAKGEVVAFNAATGAVAWKATPGGGVLSAIAVAGDVRLPRLHRRQALRPGPEEGRRPLDLRLQGSGLRHARRRRRRRLRRRPQGRRPRRGPQDQGSAVDAEPRLQEGRRFGVRLPHRRRRPALRPDHGRHRRRRLHRGLILECGSLLPFWFFGVRQLAAVLVFWMADPLPLSGFTCLACGYDLRGLAQPACPECGGAP